MMSKRKKLITSKKDENYNKMIYGSAGSGMSLEVEKGIQSQIKEGRGNKDEND